MPFFQIYSVQCSEFPESMVSMVHGNLGKFADTIIVPTSLFSSGISIMSMLYVLQLSNFIGDSIPAYSCLFPPFVTVLKFLYTFI